MLVYSLGLFTPRDVQNMLREVKKMSMFEEHPNIMPLLGVCMDAGAGVSLIMPYMEQGSLLDYLRRERNNLVIPNSPDTTTDSVSTLAKPIPEIISLRFQAHF